MGNRTARSMKKHTAKRKAARLLLEAAMRQLKPRRVKANPSTEAYVRAVIQTSPRGDKRALVSFRPALLGYPSLPPIRLDDVDLVGMAEDPKEFGQFLATLGVTLLASLTGAKLEPATKMGELLESTVKWLGVDLEALQKAAAEEEERAKAPLEVKPEDQALALPAEGEAL